jgi:hypothetical protein
MNKLVVRFADGRMVKGTTLDFSPAKNVFHVTEAADTAGTPVAVRRDDLKALFFVKDYEGDPRHVEKREFDAPPPPGARRVQARFDDGEVLVGTTNGYNPELPGFFMAPADTESNITRCFVVATAAHEVRML